MNPFEMVVLIILIVTIGRVAQARMGVRRFNRRDGIARPDADDRLLAYQDSAEAQRLRDEVRTLKERVAVLERIATDGNRSAELDREIEALRKQP